MSNATMAALKPAGEAVGSTSAQALNEEHALMAGATVESLFPPRNVETTYAVVSALNLLNAIVKRPWGPDIVSYYYIKGMEACTFLWLLKHPMEGVNIYWDKNSRVTYFHILNHQFSFHYVPMLNKYRLRFDGLAVQQWNGIRLQHIALDLFLPYYRRYADAIKVKRSKLCRRMLLFSDINLRNILSLTVGISQPYVYQRMQKRKRINTSREMRYKWDRMTRYQNPHEQRACLQAALHFHIWTSKVFDLYRPNDEWHVVMGRYNGNNYRWLRYVLSTGRRAVHTRPAESLVAGRLYYCQRSDRLWTVLTASRHLLLLAQYSFLKHGNKLYSLCLTYGIACHLAAQYPRLRFINVLNYARLTVHHRVYTHKGLLSIPAGSKARSMKVWLLVDRKRELQLFDVTTLPPALLEEYYQTPNYTQQYQIVGCYGKMGLYAYCRFHLLPPIYLNITIRGNYAQVMSHNHKMAVFSLAEERFLSDFIYDSIWYDAARKTIYGRVRRNQMIIHKFT